MFKESFSLMDFLSSKSEIITKSSFYGFVSSMIILINPLALAPQVWTVFVSPSVEGLSITMWVLFALIQLALTFEGIKSKNLAMFLSMLISMTESLAIIVVILIRT